MRNEWIDVNDSLPNDYTDVLFYNSGYKRQFIGRLYDKETKEFWDQSGDTHSKVTYWMPLPLNP